MNRQNTTKALTESSILTSIAIILSVMSAYIPFIVIAAFFGVPAIVAFIYNKHGARYSGISIVSIFIVTLWTTGIVSAITSITLWGFFGIGLGFCIKNKKSAATSIIILSVVVFLSIIINLKILTIVTGTDVISQGITIMNQSYAATREIYIQMGIDKETVDKTLATMPTSKEIIGYLPSMLIIMSLMSSFLGYYVIQKIFKRLKYQISEVEPLSQWYLPRRVAFGIIMIFGVSVFMMFSGVQNGQNYYVNANVILTFFFTINALALISFFLKKKNVNKVARPIIILFCLLPPIGFYIYFIGIFDYMFDYRQLDDTRRRPIE